MLNNIPKRILFFHWKYVEIVNSELFCYTILYHIFCTYLGHIIFNITIMFKSHS